MPNPDILNKKVASYYENVSHLYEKYLNDHEHNNLHYGYTEDDADSIESTEESTNGLNQLLADTADIGSDDRVLFCGCGFGGPAIWVARNRGAETIGINIVERQLEEARKNASEAGVEDQTDFRYDDLTKMETIDDGEIDVVWAIEAVIYAEDKRDFFEQARRVLGDDGRLVVAEGFRTQRSFSGDEEQLLEKLKDGWAIPNLEHVDDFTAQMDETGFTNIEVNDITQNVRAFAEWQFLSRHYKYVFKLLHLAGLMSDAEYQHQLTRRYQYRTIQKDLLTYTVVSAEL